MKYLYLIWKNLWRRKLRTLLTIFSTIVAFVLFGLLSAVRMGFRAGVDVSGADRMMVTHKISIILPLPVSYQEPIKTTPGVQEVTHANWFGGIYKEQKNFFPQMAVDVSNFLDLYPEYVLPADQKKAWQADRTAAIVGRATADRFGFKVGDRITLEAPWLRKDGGRNWEFNVAGIYDGAQKGTDTSALYFNYDYMKESLASNSIANQVGWYIIRIADPSRSPEVAQRIDAQFANSPAETKTQTEKELAQGFANQVGNIGVLVTAVVAVVFLTLLLVVANTMALSIRERFGELAVLKTLGFTHVQVMLMVLAESCAVALLGALLGLGAALVIVPGIGKKLQQFIPVFYVPPRDLVLGLAIALLLGIAAGLPPAWQAMRLRIVEALRRV
ncbi:MAG: ABC transporter permease [Thermoanaerobaculia bacterium]